MKANEFKMTPDMLSIVAHELDEKINAGLVENDLELRCLPTYVNPKSKFPEKRVLVLDLGGTNFRAAIVKFLKQSIIIESMNQRDLTEIMKREKGQEAKDTDLFDAFIDIMKDLGSLEGIDDIGYCFSYPCENEPTGDAKLIEWTKGVNVKGMVGKPIGDSLIKYFNSKLGTSFKNIAVINDTVAALLCGCIEQTDACTYIGLIVGTGTNMAGLFPSKGVPKLSSDYKGKNILINLESGNFNPPYSIAEDDLLDEGSNNQGRQRFEKRVSGMYLGNLLEYSFPYYDFGRKFDAEGLTNIMSTPDIYDFDIVKTADWIYERSAKLVAASLAGLIFNLSKKQSVKKVCITAEGGLYWSKDTASDSIRSFKSYSDIVKDELDKLLKEIVADDIEVNIVQKKNANILGTAVAAISVAKD
ncbi:hexokinase [Bacteroidales bacterium OttesenSCG-928-I14]|nr:hexokinase [Bacteroidales bacterium OttesenSCG-928-I14]